jgi:hypothetical protein
VLRSEGFCVACDDYAFSIGFFFFFFFFFFCFFFFFFFSFAPLLFVYAAVNDVAVDVVLSVP